jgi:acyl-CoA reductase-like NAD-dependent aldehyde dehydrogenase
MSRTASQNGPRSGSTPTSRFVSEMPHGGFKHSGYGKDRSGYGFDDCTRIKHAMSNIEA